MNTSLPAFTVDGYRNLIHDLVLGGFSMKPISALPDRKENSVYLRHDIDFSASLSIPIAELEHSAGLAATYFVLLTGPYNPFHKDTIKALVKIRDLGHEIGLHYDLANWSQNKQSAASRLVKEVGILEFISGAKINSLVMHEPSQGGEDFFATESAAPAFINPSYYQKNDTSLRYVSDSCRAWRDDSLVKFIQRELPQTRLMLNTHPESWLATGRLNRIAYLEQVLAPAATKSVSEYFLKTVKHLWKTQPAAVHGFGDENQD